MCTGTNGNGKRTNQVAYCPAFNSASGCYTVLLTTPNIQISLVLQQIWPIAPEVVLYDIAVRQLDAGRPVFCSAFPIRPCWRYHITLGSDESASLPRGISDIREWMNRHKKDIPMPTPMNLFSADFEVRAHPCFRSHDLGADSPGHVGQYTNTQRRLIRYLFFDQHASFAEP